MLSTTPSTGMNPMPTPPVRSRTWIYALLIGCAVLLLMVLVVVLVKKFRTPPVTEIQQELIATATSHATEICDGVTNKEACISAQQQLFASKTGILGACADMSGGERDQCVTLAVQTSGDVEQCVRVENNDAKVLCEDSGWLTRAEKTFDISACAKRSTPIKQGNCQIRVEELIVDAGKCAQYLDSASCADRERFARATPADFVIGFCETFTDGLVKANCFADASLYDVDADGMTGLEENGYGTDPWKFDTDDDGLSDGAEVEKWHSDPLNVDTDADTYPDGEEVQNGYSPLGTGKLLM